MRIEITDEERRELDIFLQRENHNSRLNHNFSTILDEFHTRLITGTPLVTHSTEQKYPEQCKMFRELLEEEYQIHLKKNADYSIYNVNATGTIGLVVRMWDKMARIMNLTGFDIGTGKFSGEKINTVEDETIVDTAKDMGTYAKIFRIYKAGKWGK